MYLDFLFPRRLFPLRVFPRRLRRGLLTPCEVAGMQATIAQTFPDTATVLRNLETRDANNFPQEDWQTVTQPSGLLTVPCRVRERTTPGRELLQGEKPTTRSMFEIALPFDADVEEKDRIQTLEGDTFVVNRTSKGASDALRIIALCERVA